jgi:PPOX class probable F420-dependent enzyme
MPSASTLGGAPAWALDLLECARVARLGLLDDDGRPRVQPVAYALARGALYTAVDWKPKAAREPARVRFLRARPAAALTADRYDDDWDALAWVQVLGAVDVLDDPAGDAAGIEALVAKYAPYRDRPPAGPLLRLRPERALWWRASERA